MDKFKEQFNNLKILQHSNLESICSAFKEELTRTLDELIPLKKPRKNAKPARPWYRH